MFDAHQDLIVLGLLLLIGLVGVIATAVAGQDDHTLDAEPSGNRTPKSPVPRPRAEPTASASAAQPSVTTPATEPVRFDPRTYRSLAQREFTRIAKSPDEHVGEQVVVFGQITDLEAAIGGESFLAKSGAVRSGSRRRTVAKYTVGTGLTWQRGFWVDELRPASQQLAGLAEGDLFEAFVTVAASQTDGQGSDAQGDDTVTVPAFVVDRINVYASAPG